MASSTLSLRGKHVVKVPTRLLSKEPTYVMRYWLVAEIITKLYGSKSAAKSILEVGGNGSLLPDFMGRKVTLLDLPDNDSEDYIQASALAMPINDDTYDVVASCDVLEHIPGKDRVQFIKELLRVSREYVILCGPMYKEQTAEAEKRANGFFKSVFRREHPWLVEHIANGLPKPDELESILDAENATYTKFEHGNLDSWEMLTKLNFLEVEPSLGDDSDVASEVNNLNQQYSSKLGYDDFPEVGYRTIYIIQKQKSASRVELDLPENGLPSAGEIGIQYAGVMEKLAVAYHAQNAELNKVNGDAQGLLDTTKKLREELDNIYGSKYWNLMQIPRRALSPLVKILRKLRVIALLRFIKTKSTAVLAKLPFFDRALNIANTELRRRKIQAEREFEYQIWVRRNQPNQAELDMQRETSKTFAHQPTISLIMPTYNTDPAFLKECIESVLAQTYEKWELCIADDASSDQRVREVLSGYGEQDSRVKFMYRESNGHICEASNSALELATGEFVGLLDHDDIIWPNALFEVVGKINAQPDADFVYTDEDKIDQVGMVHTDPFFKPDWSPDFLRSLNYITHFAVIKKQIVDKVGGFRKGYEGAQDWDLFLRVSRVTDRIYHIPKVLYSWRKSVDSTAMLTSSKKYAFTNQKNALADDANEMGLKIESIKWAVPNFMWHTNYEVAGRPKVSIIIPTKNQYNHISKCLKSIIKKTTYTNYEIIIVDTGSTEPNIWSLYDRTKEKFSRTKVVRWEEEFNFAKVCNFGSEHATGEYYLFLNNDTEVITKSWIEGLLQYAQQDHVGAVGCKLLYPNHTLQHAGVVLGVGGNAETPSVAAHLFPGYQDHPVEDPLQPLYVGGVRDFSAVTAACVMVHKSKFAKVHGFDGRFQIAWNDVDFCLKLREQGWYNVYTPYVKLFHHESVSVGLPGSKHRDLDLFNEEIKMFGDKWGWDYINNDPYYSLNFRRDTANMRLSLETNPRD